jgi:hypothetical protein
MAAMREMQAPLLALVLLGACAIKLSRVLRVRSVFAILGATALFPPRLRRPATVALCATEMSLGVGLLVTMGPAGAGGWADGVRLAAALFFLVGMCALVELRERRPDLGCGCFGDLSKQPPGGRSVLRAGLLAGAALAGVHIQHFHPPPPGPRAAADLGILLAELLVLALISPEPGEMLVRLGYSEPCQVRVVPPRRALTALHRSRRWRQHASMITGGPADMWRELCWWYLVYPARDRGRDCQVVFAVEVKPHRPAIHAAVVGPVRGPVPGRPPEPVPGRPPTQVPGGVRNPAPAQVPSAIF